MHKKLPNKKLPKPFQHQEAHLVPNLNLGEVKRSSLVLGWNPVEVKMSDLVSRSHSRTLLQLVHLDDKKSSATEDIIPEVEEGMILEGVLEGTLAR